MQFECRQQFLEILIGVGSTLGSEPIVIIGIGKGIAKKGNFDKFNLKMANGTIAKPSGLLRDVKIHIHGIPYIVTLTVIDFQTIKSDYSMLLGRPWLRNAKVIRLG